MRKIQLIILILFLFTPALTPADTSPFKMARLKYAGGGDWYNDPSAEVNMMKFLKDNTTIDVAEPKFYTADVATNEIFEYSFLLLTGHGNIEFSTEEAAKLRKYCESGGFLFADDDYGMDESFRREVKKIFPDKELKELPFSHPVYSSHYQFPNGLPKTHEHDAKPPQGFGIFDRNGRLCLYYCYESNISDGWADPREHEDPITKREEAMKMGVNLIVYALMN